MQIHTTTYTLKVGTCTGTILYLLCPSKAKGTGYHFYLPGKSHVHTTLNYIHTLTEKENNNTHKM